MDLQGQAARRGGRVGEAGFALAALLVAVAILSLMLLVALPTWSHQAQREKEIELIFRGEQYARAIGLYQRKIAGAFPPSLDILVEQKYLRKKYKDPITDDDFLPVYANSAAARAVMGQQGGSPAAGPAGPAPPTGPAPGLAGRTGPEPPGGWGTGTGSARVERQRPFGTQAPDQAGPGGAAPGAAPASALSGPAGGIVGVMSKSKARAIRLHNGRDRYDQWVFVYMNSSAQAGPAGPPGQTPGQPATQTAPGLPQRAPRP